MEEEKEDLQAERKEREQTMYDLIIIGAGPAGLSAALYGARAGLKLLLIEQNPMEGGQILTTDVVDNYLGIPGINGFELGMKFREHAVQAGVECRNACVKAVRVETEQKKVVELISGEQLETRAIIVATGASHALLGVPGEKEYKGRGVSYCATCDGAFFKGAEVAVVGGGNVAAGDAVYLARFCKKVYLIHRRDSLRASASLQKKLTECPNIETVWNSVVTKITGEDTVEGICIREAGGQQEEQRTIHVSGVFVAVGMEPQTQLFREWIKCDEKGYLEASEDCETSVPGIFAAGDVRTKGVRQIVTAVADGACAMAGVQRYLAQLS